MRGKHETAESYVLRFRITPADAGKTYYELYNYQRSQDHPRGCGENLNIFAYLMGIKGSPPRMRGKLFYNIFYFFGSRITPADAGKTKILKKKNHKITDHPRGCGENGFGFSFPFSLVGSPPRMRGKPFETSTASHSTRITPADAGKTHPLSPTNRMSRDHPRGCGENRARPLCSRRKRGSPPRMRGKRAPLGAGG